MEATERKQDRLYGTVPYRTVSSVYRGRSRKERDKEKEEGEGEGEGEREGEEE